MTQQEKISRSKTRLKKDPLDWVEDTAKAGENPLQDLIATAAYDLLMTAIVVSDTDMVIRYANPAAMELFGAAEAEIQKDLPHFSVGTMLGQNIDVFHKNPAHQRALMANMTAPHDATLTAGDVTLAFRVTRLMPDGETLVGYVVELHDVTYERDSREQVAKLLGKLDAMVEDQLAGDTSSLVDASDLKGVFHDLAAKVNSMIAMRNDVSLQVLRWIQGFTSGDLETKAPEFPGESAAITKGIERARSLAIEARDQAQQANHGIERLLEEIAAMAKNHNAGQIDAFIDTEAFDGSLRVVADNVNSMVCGHISIKQQMLDILECFSLGDFDAPFPALPGKRAYISEGVEAMRANFKSVMAEIARISGAISEGQLDVTINTSMFEGDYRSIIEQFANVLDILNATFRAITVEVSQASVAVAQMSDAAKELASNSQIQSASVDEVSASAEETDAQVKANAASASQANTLVTGAVVVADQGKEKIGQMVKAMEDIRASSQDIAKIIKVIDEIAFQTNLLALNAAVEAARAGQHGRGFAVVAQEVRNLAARSAKAAKETSDLIDSAGSRVQTGVKIADEASRAFVSIAEDISKVRSFMSEISVASQEQARGVAQINAAMGEVAKTALATSQQAEDVADGVTELAQATDRMRHEMGRFTLRAPEEISVPTIPDLQTLPPEILSQIHALLQSRMGAVNGAVVNGRDLDRDERGFRGF